MEPPLIGALGFELLDLSCPTSLRAQLVVSTHSCLTRKACWEHWIMGTLERRQE